MKGLFSALSSKKPFTFLITLHQINNLLKETTLYIVWKKGLNETGTSNHILIKNHIAVWEQDFLFKTSLTGEEGKYNAKNISFSVFEVQISNLIYFRLKEKDFLDPKHFVH